MLPKIKTREEYIVIGNSGFHFILPIFLMAVLIFEGFYKFLIFLGLFGTGMIIKHFRTKEEIKIREKWKQKILVE